MDPNIKHVMTEKINNNLNKVKKQVSKNNNVEHNLQVIE